MIYNLTNKMDKKVLRATETYLLKKGVKCTFDGKIMYEFLGMDGMYGRFKDKDGMIGFAYGKFKYDDVKDLYICINDKE